MLEQIIVYGTIIFGYGIIIFLAIYIGVISNKEMWSDH